MDIREIQSEKYNKALAEALKSIKEFEKPEWVDFVKTSVHKTRSTVEEDFWYKRSASILRQRPKTSRIQERRRKNDSVEFAASGKSGLC